MTSILFSINLCIFLQSLLETNILNLKLKDANILSSTCRIALAYLRTCLTLARPYSPSGLPWSDISRPEESSGVGCSSNVVGYTPSWLSGLWRLSLPECNRVDNVAESIVHKSRIWGKIIFFSDSILGFISWIFGSWGSWSIISKIDWWKCCLNDDLLLLLWRFYKASKSFIFKN